MTKTVEDILKDEGVIAPVQESSEAEEEPAEKKHDLTRLMIDIEKLQTEVNTLKDFKKQSDEVMRELTEKIGEIRSMFFQRESLIKETETKVKILDDMVSDISPSKYMKEMESRKKEVLELQARVEKYDTVGSQLNKDISSIKEIVQNIRSIENLEKIMEEIHSSVSKNREIKFDIEREAGKTERFYLEMENKIKDFMETKEKVSRMDDMLKELTRNLDVINIKLAGFLSKDDIETIRKSINQDMASNRSYIESKLKEVEGFLNLPSQEMGSRIEQLKERREGIEKMLSGLEDQYKKAVISEKTYLEVKQKNESLIEEMGAEIEKIQTGQTASFKDLPAILKNLEDRASTLENRMDEERNIVDQSLKSMLSDSKMADMVNLMKSQTSMINSIIDKMKELGDKTAETSAVAISFDSRIKYFEIMDELLRADNPKDVGAYLAELEALIAEMRASGLWNAVREKMTLNLLADIAENWKRYNYNDVAQMFLLEIQRMQATRAPAKG